MIADPAAAPRRSDLPFLRHRARPRAAAPVAATPVAAAPVPAHPSTISFDRPGRAPARSAASSTLDLGSPTPTPTPTPAPITGPPAAVSFARPSAPSAPPVPSGSLAPSPATAPPVAQKSGSLDLSDAPATATPVRRAPSRALRGARVRPGAPYLLGVRTPTVVLTRVQSGVGQLELEATVPPGDLRLGAAYELGSGIASTVQLCGGNRFAPSSRRPVIVAGHDEFEHLRVDLRQVRDLRRMAVYVFSESRTELAWNGTLVVTTSGGARVELPLETLYRGRIAVPMTIYNFGGELVLRAELETIAGDVREAARAYGFDRITWRDDRTPID